MKVLPVVAEAHDPYQLLRAIVVIEAGPVGAQRRDGLN